MKAIFIRLMRTILNDESDIYTLIWVSFWFIALFAYHLFK